MANRHIKRCSLSLIRETQIKTTMRYHLTLVRMTIINKSTNNKCWQECGGKGSPMQMGVDIVESSIKLPQKIKNGIAYDPMIPFLEI